MAGSITEHIDIWTAAQTPKTNGGRGRRKNSNGQSPHGIKKLRELILELAVRGKLVPQDPNDQPASILLKKIAKEKARLVKEGKNKKQKTLPEISEDEKPFELPGGWEWAYVGECFSLKSGTSFNKEKELAAGRYIYAKVADMNIEGNEVEITTSSRFIDPSSKDLNAIIPAGSIVFPKRGGAIATNKKKIVKNDLFVDLNIMAITPFEGVNLDFAYRWLLGIDLAILNSGTSVPQINNKDIAPLFFPIPPLVEQYRIVAKVDELMALCDQLKQQQTDSNTAHQTLVGTLLTTLTNAADQGEFAEAWQRIANHFDTLFTTEQSIDQLKQTILQLAVMGKLVPRDPTDLPAPQSGKFFVYALECEDKSIYIGQTDDILKRWKEHATGKGADWTKKHPPLRLVHWEEYNSRKEAINREKELKTGFGRKWIKRELAAGRTRQAGEPAGVLLEKIAEEKARLIKEGKTKKQKPLPEITKDEKPFDLPQGWEWVRIGDASMFTEYGLSEKTFDGINGIPVIKMGDIQDRKVILGGQKLVPENVEGLPSLYLKKWDLLYNRTNSAELVGKTGIYDGPDDAYTFASYLVKIRCSENCVHPKYLNLSMNTPLFRVTQIEPHLKQQCGQANVNATIMRNMIIPVPPINKQHSIVAKVDELMILCDTLKARLKDAQTTQVQLADAIVEEAVA